MKHFKPHWRRILISALIFLLPLTLLIPGKAAFGYKRQTAVVEAVKQVSPAVVNISTQYAVNYRPNPFARFGMEDFFKDFFDHRPQRKRKLNSLGSGVIIDGERGYILTNSHVIVKSGKITAVLKDGREFSAEIVGADTESDLAVLQISSEKPLPAIDMGDSDDLMIGETVIAIGNPFGFSHTVTTGVISAVNRSFTVKDRIYRDFIQTDASINPGNSGGPLLNINGELIGVNTAIYRNAEGIGFAIPINKAKKIVSDLIAYGKVMHAWLGLQIQDADKQMARYFNLEDGQGLVVQRVQPDSPAAKAGIREGDVILRIDDTQMRAKTDYRAAMRGCRKGQSVSVHLLRNGEKKTLSVNAARFPQSLAPKLARQLLGVEVVDISRREHFDRAIAADAGVIIADIDAQSALAGVGVEPGDVIRKINDIKTDDPESFHKAVVKYRWKDSVVILLQRGTKGYYITVDL